MDSLCVQLSDDRNIDPYNWFCRNKDVNVFTSLKLVINVSVHGLQVKN